MLVEEAVYRKVTEGFGAIMALPAATERHKFVLIFLYWVGGGVRELVMLKGYCECFRKYMSVNACFLPTILFSVSQQCVRCQREFSALDTGSLVVIGEEQAGWCVLCRLKEPSRVYAIP